MGYRIFTSSTTDQCIFGQEMVTMLSVTLIAVIFHWTLTSFKKDYSLTASSIMKVPCIVSILSFLLMNVIGMIGWNNVFIPITSISCKIIYPLCLILYNIGKIAMYLLFTYRIQLIFKHTTYKLNKLSLKVYRIFCIFIPSTLWMIWIYLSWNDVKPHYTDSTNPQYKYCFPLTWNYNQIFAEVIASLIALTDLFFSGIPLVLFIYKYIQITSLYNNLHLHRMRDNQNNQNIKQHIIPNAADDNLYNSLLQQYNNSLPGFNVRHLKIIRKSTMLVIVAILSTWCFIIGQAYLLRQIGFYLSFDCIINCLCIACLFQFGDDFYSITFAKFECCCFWDCCKCCSLSKDDGDDSDNDVSFTTSSPINNNNKHNAAQYHAKIHSHNDMNNIPNINIEPQRTTKVYKINKKSKHPSLFFRNTPTMTSLPTQINISTPTQRHSNPIDQHLFPSQRQAQSITEFIPIQDNKQSSITPNNRNNNDQQYSQYSHTPDSNITDSTSHNMKPLLPANKDGNILILNKKKSALL